MPITAALPLRRRAIVRTVNPHPILRLLAQSFADRIHQDVTGFLFKFVVIAQAMIEKIALPSDTMFSSDELFPDESLVVEAHRGEHGIATICAAQLVLARRHAVDRDKEPTPLGHPLWNCVRQLFADWEIHRSKLSRRSPGNKRK